MRKIYALVMDGEKNPLKKLPYAQRFQVMALLSVMWTTAFCVGISSWAYYGELMLFHVAVLIAIGVTSMSFKQAASVTVSHREKYRDTDGTVRYDDLWGG